MVVTSPPTMAGYYDLYRLQLVDDEAGKRLSVSVSMSDLRKLRDRLNQMELIDGRDCQ